MIKLLFIALLACGLVSVANAAPSAIAAPVCDAGVPFSTTDANGIIHTGCRGTSINPKPISLTDALTKQVSACKEDYNALAMKLTKMQNDKATSDDDKQRAVSQSNTDRAAVGAAHDQHMNDLQTISDLQRQLAAALSAKQADPSSNPHPATEVVSPIQQQNLSPNSLGDKFK
jgi:hypothetical protein